MKDRIKVMIQTTDLIIPSHWAPYYIKPTNLEKYKKRYGERLKVI